ncbi:hypothetical protein C6P76_29285 [Burkholderia multivorans]|uniref:hypothetical protein n=1 Tax=Burkholderia multivorans TaxID=87883 RepID=UPI000CFEA426|nr:hypothetical protein [Burkholderia multivorans]PRD80472.1 hypothetical protein C6P76_29285 [Burkholderia multivorans]
MNTTDKSSADALTDRIKAMFVQNPSDELGPSDEPESQYRFGYNTALEDVLAAVEQHEAAQADAQVCQHCDCTYPLHDLDCPVAVEASKRAAQPEQPATTCSLCHDSGYMDETLGGALPGVPDAPCVNGCKPEPPAAAERAAFETLKGAWQSMPPFDVFCAGWRAARAASANETGAQESLISESVIQNSASKFSQAAPSGERVEKISDYLNAPGMWAQVYCCAVFVHRWPSDMARSAADEAVKEFGDSACKTVADLTHTLDEVLRAD